METFTPLMRTIDLSIDETQSITLHDGSTATVKLLAIHETRDAWRKAIRQASVDVEVNGSPLSLPVSDYHFPVQFNGVKIDCPITAGFLERNLLKNMLQLDKAARFRLWPEDSPLTVEGSLIYPVRRRWFAERAAAGLEPSDRSVTDPASSIYYHDGFDISAPEDMVDVYSTTEGVVIAAGENVIRQEGMIVASDIPEDESQVDYIADYVLADYDTVYIEDGHGWYHMYRHLASIDDAITVGTPVKQGQRIGQIGKEGASGGESHLHYHILGIQPSGRRGTIEAFPLLWEVYQKATGTTLLASVGPHAYTTVGEPITLNGRRSWSAKGSSHITAYRWLLTDGSTVDNIEVEVSYDRPGIYSELLFVTDADGQIAWGQITLVVGKADEPDYCPPGIHLAYEPTLDLRVGQEITFKVRSFDVGAEDGSEIWDFGDGSSPVSVRSDGGTKGKYAPDGYAVTTHSYQETDTYIVSVTRETSNGEVLQERIVLEIE